MNPDHAHFAEWDAAYVIGALSSAERREFEEHLADCVECRRAVVELAPTVGLLSRVSLARAESIDGQPGGDGPDDAVRQGIVSVAQQRAVRRRRAWWVAVAAAVVVVVAAIAIPVTLIRTAPAASFALESVADVPLEATVRLSDVGWGTRIDLECRYTSNPTDVPADGWPYSLAVVDLDGVVTGVSTWRATPGSLARLSAGTDLDLAQIGAIEIRSIESGRVLMRYKVDDPRAP